MSFILDALKKSESDRQRQSGPSLFEVKVAPPRRVLPIWAVAIAVLLLVNIVVISWMLLRRPAERQPPASVAAESPPASSPAIRAPTQNAAPAPQAAPSSLPGPSTPGSATANSTPPPAATATPPLSGTAAPANNGGPAGLTANGGPPAGATGSGSPSAPARSESSSAPVLVPPSAATSQASGAATGGDPSDYAPAVEPSSAQGSGAGGTAGGELPLYQQISGSAALPDLHLDLHVFAARPQDRFVMINMHRLGEGGTLPNGVQVDAIRPDGVVLSYHGTRFLLPRS